MTSKGYKDFLEEIDSIVDQNQLKDYHAFVYWFIESMYGLEKIKILNSICDKTHDKGIDGVIIDDVEKNVLIIQSKFEREGGSVQIKDSELKLLSSVKSYFESRRGLDAAMINANQVVKRLLNDAFDSVKTKNYHLELIFITTHKSSPNMISLVRDTLGFKIGEFSIHSYDDILQLHMDRLRDFTPPIGSYCLPYQTEDNNMVRTSSHKSWVISAQLDDLRRMVNKFGDKLFRKNVRNFLGKNKCNKKIIETLEKEQQNFWYYNNGITILCDEANIVIENKYIRLVNPQIVNGCQTARSIELYQKDLKGDILVRIIESKDHDFISSLTLYQNTSNPVKKRDLKSNDPIQIRLKHEFKRKKIYYEIKRGEEYQTMIKKYPAMKQYYAEIINNECLAKLLASIRIGSYIAASKGSEAFFDDYYEELFTPQIKTYDCLSLYKLYDNIKEEYYGSKKKFYEFEKASNFKTRAAYHVLRFIYDSLGNLNRWENKFILALENNNRGYKIFSKDLRKVITKYFKLIYKTWKNSEEPYYNTFLQNSNTYKTIQKTFKRECKELDKRTKLIFERFIS